MLSLIVSAGKFALPSTDKLENVKKQKEDPTNNLEKKTIDVKKFLKKDEKKSLPDGENSSSALVLRGTSAISTKKINTSSFLDKKIDDDKKTKNDDDDNKEDFEEILKVMSSIKESLLKIDDSIKLNLNLRKKQLNDVRIQKSKKSAEEKESDLENKKKRGFMGILANVPKIGFFDVIKNYLLNVFLGTLAVFALSKLPQIISAFNTISKNMSNVFNMIKYGIISLTTNFPKQIKSLAKLFQKIVTSKPAKAIGQLLAQAGKAVANIFGKAAKSIFNLIKGPLKNLLGKTVSGALGSAAKGIRSIGRRGLNRSIPRAAAKLGGKNAAQIAERLGLLTGKGRKHFSKVTWIFKKIPFIGALIGIGIDLALGVKPDVAVAGAIGTSLGAAIGGAVGTGLIPIPILGTAVGGIIGAGVGDWAGKEIYKNLKGYVSEILPGAKPDKTVVSKKSEGGESETTRKTSVEKRKIKKIIIDRPIRKPGKAQPVLKSTSDKAKKYFFKNSNASKRFERLSNTYTNMKFVGPLLKLGIDIGMGEKAKEGNINAAADTLAYSIATAIKREDLQFPGVNRNTSGTIANSLSVWARREIDREIMSRQGDFAIRSEDKTDGSATGELGEGMGVYVSSDSPDFWLLATAAMFENSDPQGAADVAQAIYNRVSMPGDPWNVNNSISKAILNPGQFQPVSQYGGASTWSQIKTKDDALKFVKRYGKTQAQLETVAAAILDKSRQQSARDFVGPRDSFRADSYEKANDHLANDTEKSRLGHTFGFEPRGATIGAFRANKLTAAMVSDTITGEVTSGPAAMVTGGTMGVKTSGFGWRDGKMHTGIDIDGGDKSPISSSQDATVVHAGFLNDGFGNSVILKYSNGAETRFAHLDKINVRSGQKIRAGQLIGTQGDTGASRRSHLHFEYFPSGNAMSYSGHANPENFVNSYLRFGGSVRPKVSQTPMDSAGKPDSPIGKVIRSFKVANDVFTEREGGKYFKNAKPIDKSYYDAVFKNHSNSASSNISPPDPNSNKIAFSPINRRNIGGNISNGGYSDQISTIIFMPIPSGDNTTSIGGGGSSSGGVNYMITNNPKYSELALTSTLYKNG